MNFAGLQNYNEPLVFDVICKELISIYNDCDEEFFLDVACYALANLPARYLRNQIDMAFYLTPKEREQLQSNATKAVYSAAEYIYGRRDIA